MTKTVFLIVSIISLFSACNNNSEKTPENKTKVPYCDSLRNNTFVYKLAKSLIEKGGNENLGNLSEIGSSELLVTEDYFIDKEQKHSLILIGGYTGYSASTADNMLMLLSCTDSLRVLWAGQMGDIKPSDIIDMNGDGIKEIISTANSLSMGQCNDSYHIFNFKGGKQNTVFEAHSMNLIGCGYDKLAGYYKPGDTLGHSFDCSLVKTNEKEYAVRRIETIKIYNTGKKDEEIVENLKVIVDTAIVKIK